MALRHDDETVGGQALIEGVMMRTKERVSWAVRRPDGEIAVESLDYTALSKRNKVCGLPVVRGFVSLVESLSLGYRALMRSAELAGDEKRDVTQKRSLRETLEGIGTFALALAISLGLFMFLPMWVSERIAGKDSDVLFNLISGCLRVALLLGYLAGISLWKEIRRVFEYHGAEHKTIFTFEDGKDLTLENARPYPTFHARCGTSFLLLVVFICVALFATIDALVTAYIAPYPNIGVRFLVHLSLVPIVSGISYEVLKLADRKRHLPFIRALNAPGLWLQRITTRQPDDGQLEVARAALEAAVDQGEPPAEDATAE